jgi:hypothetical protein
MQLRMGELLLLSRHHLVLLTREGGLLVHAFEGLPENHDAGDCGGCDNKGFNGGNVRHGSLVTATARVR